MKKILVLYAISIMLVNDSAHAIDDVASERFSQRSTNFGGSAQNSKTKTVTSHGMYTYSHYKSYGSNKTTTVPHNGTLNSYTVSKNNIAKKNN